MYNLTALYPLFPNVIIYNRFINDYFLIRISDDKSDDKNESFKIKEMADVFFKVNCFGIANELYEKSLKIIINHAENYSDKMTFFKKIQSDHFYDDVLTDSSNYFMFLASFIDNISNQIFESRSLIINLQEIELINNNNNFILNEYTTLKEKIKILREKNQERKETLQKISNKLIENANCIKFKISNH